MIAEPEAGTPMIKADRICKTYGDFQALTDVTFSVPKGQVAAILGPNGSGKTTTMKILTGFLTPSSGRTAISGFDLETHRLEAAEKAGYLPKNGPLYQDMTPLGLFRVFGNLRGMGCSRLRERLDSVTQLCGLQSVLKKPMYKHFKGYRQRVGMARSVSR